MVVFRFFIRPLITPGGQKVHFFLRARRPVRPMLYSQSSFQGFEFVARGYAAHSVEKPLCPFQPN